ncbi:MAG: shikimate kinase [Phormidesmis sp.]
MSASFLKKTNLYLIGMMGAGKTTIGRRLANRLGYGFLDTDKLIEQALGKPVSNIFADEGEAAFRQLESDVLAQVSAYTSQVVATGGGIVTQPMNWGYLRHGVVIWLDVPIPVLVSRLSGDTSRPLLKEGDLTTKLEDLFSDRHQMYALADIQIAYEGRSVGKTCDRVIAKLQQTIGAEDQPNAQKIASEIVINQTNINAPVKDT